MCESRPIHRPCQYCRGTGRVALTPLYAATYRLLEAHPGANGAELGELAGCTGEAMCNRLVVLERLGLAHATPNGREKLWHALKEVGADAP